MIVVLLEVDDLELAVGLPKTDPVNVVSGCSLRVDAREVVGIVGESGCGKSLTLRAILGLLPVGVRITRGSIRFSGRELVGLSEPELRMVRGESIGMVFQEPMSALNPTMRIGDQIGEAPRRRGKLSRREGRKLAVELLERVGVPAPSMRERQYPHELSGGMRQRVVIAIALSLRPRLLLCDEPTTALDVTIQKQVLGLLNELVDEMDLAVVMVTHDFGVIAEACSRTAVMYAGKIVEVGPSYGILRKPRHPYTLALLESVPGSDVGPELQGIPGAPPSPGQRPGGCPFHPRCRYALDRCAQDEPPLREVADGWSSACLLTGRAVQPIASPAV